MLSKGHARFSKGPYKSPLITLTLAESICTHYSKLSGRPDNFLGSVTFKILGTFCKKQGAKKQGHCYSKGEKIRLPLLFLNNNDPVFLHPAVCKKQGSQFFESFRP